ncbi:MAG: GDSL-type esterase/lipase family protein [Deltaproteobacteria bacterium]|jgi:lysophospholipase L1-like esterase|nr:GDSL-type esterase/lipase family protein [Deltaproteobacteria bacterium]
MPQIEKIVMLGDSLTEYHAWSDLLEGAGIINLGVGGDTAAGVWCRVKGAAARRPDVIVVQCGINDLGRGIGPEEIAGTHRRIWTDLAELSPGSRIVVCGLMPINEKKFGWAGPVFNNGTVRRTNEIILADAASLGHAVLDLYALTADESGSLPDHMTIDGVHLTPAAYEIWTRALRELLEKI